MTRESDRDRALAVVRDMRRLLRRFAFDVRHGGEGELLDDAEVSLADLTRALGPLADLVEDMRGRRSRSQSARPPGSGPCIDGDAGGPRLYIERSRSV